MNAIDDPVEKRYLMVSALGNLVIGCTGLVFSIITSSQAILLDGLFNLSYFATGLFTLKVAGLITKADDERFPAGYAFFEPLVNGMKGILVLGISLMALAGALQALFSGGRSIAAGMAIVYGCLATLGCLVAAIITQKGFKRTKSPLIHADAQNWKVNTAISSAVLLAFAAIFFIRGTRFGYMAPYVDPSLVLIVVLISISVPVRMAWQALMELLNRTPPQTVVQQVRQIVKNDLDTLPLENLFVRVLQPGRTRIVMVHAVLAQDMPKVDLSVLDELRRKTLASLKKAHLATIVDIVFTTDLALAEPASPLSVVNAKIEQSG